MPLCRSLSFTPTGSSAHTANNMHHHGSESQASAFRRVASSINAFGGIHQSPMSGRGPRAFGGPPQDHPMSYPASPAARTIDRRWSFSAAPRASARSGFDPATQVCCL